MACQNQPVHNLLGSMYYNVGSDAGIKYFDIDVLAELLKALVQILFYFKILV